MDKFSILQLVEPFIWLLSALALIWMLWPSKTYRITRDWLESNEFTLRYDHWIHYRAIKRQITARSIVMNALQSPSFLPPDLIQLNRLFNKLGQPEAVAISPPSGQRFCINTMREANAGVSGRDFPMDYVLSEVSMGVSWREEVLLKAGVATCTADRWMIHRLTEDDHFHKSPIPEFLKFLEQKQSQDVAYNLRVMHVQSFIDLFIHGTEAGHLFEAIVSAHPEDDFALVHPERGGPYSADTMATKGAKLVGKDERVSGIIYPGLIRKSDPHWRIKACVTTENPYHGPA